MPVHVVRQGECLSSIAYGFADPMTLYEHADNAEFRQLHPNCVDRPIVITKIDPS